ncbi:MAG: ThuA domain-containing protein [Phycisphaeraceae bacterium]|nr:ThuA domain-containing protein [Phycisphaeraceae bacterium]
MKSVKRVWLAGLILVGLVGSVMAADSPKKLLVVTVTKGFRHSSIPTAEKVLGQLAEKSKAFTVDYVRTDEDMATKMTAKKLRQYDGFIFANTTGILPLPDKAAFLKQIRRGKAFIGMHSASDTFHGDGMIDPYIDMCGGEFQTHGSQVGIECLVMDPDHAATKHLKQSWVINQEEVYLFKSYDRHKLRDLLSLDKHPNNKQECGHFPVTWCKMYGKGRVFYTSLGHREDVWDYDTPANMRRANPEHVSRAYQAHILNGILWAIGLADGEATPLPDSAYKQ